jgi:hypothetical protein
VLRLGIELGEIAAAGRLSGQVQMRARLFGLQLRETLERLPRRAEWSTQPGTEMKQHLAELRPRFDVVGIHADDGPIAAFRLFRIPLAHGLERLDELPVPIGQTVRELHRLGGRFQRQVRPEHPVCRDAELIPREGKTGVGGDRLVEGVGGFHIPRRTKVSQPPKVGFQRGERGGRHQGDLRESRFAHAGLAGQQLAGQLVD